MLAETKKKLPEMGILVLLKYGTVLHIFQRNILVNHDSISCELSNYLMYDISFHIVGTDKWDQNAVSCGCLKLMIDGISFHNGYIHAVVENEVSCDESIVTLF